MSQVEFLDTPGEAEQSEDEVEFRGRSKTSKRIRGIIACLALATCGVTGYAIGDHRASGDIAAARSKAKADVKTVHDRAAARLGEAHLNGEWAGERKGRADIVTSVVQKRLQSTTVHPKTTTAITYYKGVLQERTEDGWHDKAINPLAMFDIEPGFNPSKPVIGDYVGYVSGGIETGLSVDACRLGGKYRFVPEEPGDKSIATSMVRAGIHVVHEGFYYRAVGRVEGADEQIQAGYLLH